MSIIPICLLTVGLLAAVLGFRQTRAGGRKLIVSGAVVALLGFNGLQADTGLVRYLATAVVGVICLLIAATTPRATWRASRLELVLAGATVLSIWLSYFLTDVSRAIQITLLALIAAFGASFILIVLVRTARLLRSASHSRMAK